MSLIDTKGIRECHQRKLSQSDGKAFANIGCLLGGVKDNSHRFLALSLAFLVGSDMTIGAKDISHVDIGVDGFMVIAGCHPVNDHHHGCCQYSYMFVFS